MVHHNAVHRAPVASGLPKTASECLGTRLSPAAFSLVPQLSYRISSPTLQPLLSLGPVRECVKDVRLVCVYFFFMCVGFSRFSLVLVLI